MARQLSILFAGLGVALLFATPLSAQTTEPPARTAAAIADYRKSCAAERQADVPYFMAQPAAIQKLMGGNPTEILAALDRDFVSGRSDETRRYLRSAEGIRSRMAWERRTPNPNNPNNRHFMCALEVALRHALYGVPGYDHGASGGTPSSPASAPKPAPVAVAEKLPKARPGKEQPWSPRSMPTYGSNTLDPKYTAERSDILVSCSAAIRQLGVAAGAPPEDASLVFESKWLSDKDMAKGADRISEMSANNESWIATGKGNATTQATQLVGRCALQRRLAQLQGSPLIAGAIDGTLTPLSIGTSNLPGPPGKDAHIIASNGKSAMDCVKLEQVSSGDSKLEGTGGRVLVNRCSDSVEIGWCYSPGDCGNESGSSWTVRPGHSWPVKAAGEIRWSACHGANTQSFVRGSHGLRYYCSAPK